VAIFWRPKDQVSGIYRESILSKWHIFNSFSKHTVCYGRAPSAGTGRGRGQSPGSILAKQKK